MSVNERSDIALITAELKELVPCLNELTAQRSECSGVCVRLYLIIKVCYLK